MDCLPGTSECRVGSPLFATEVARPQPILGLAVAGVDGVAVRAGTRGVGDKDNIDDPRSEMIVQTCLLPIRFIITHQSVIL